MDYYNRFGNIANRPPFQVPQVVQKPAFKIPKETINLIRHFGPLIIFFLLIPGFIFEFGLEDDDEKKRKITTKTAFIHACAFAGVLKIVQFLVNKFS
jgi:hypothetical protein|tara:strand:- start:382 stop:672 length:291 start_codon:yes stop_codon:yes gene_type:complete